MSHVLMVMIIFLSPNVPSTVLGRNYLYVDQNRQWSEAIKFCRQEGAFLSVLNHEGVGSSLQACLPGNSTDLWTNMYSLATPYLSIYGCVGALDNITFLTLNSSSVFECQIMCSNYSRFAIKNKECACLHGNESFGGQKNASLCNVLCKEQLFCGGNDTVNIYDVVQQISISGTESLTHPDHNTSCVTSQCINNSYIFTERNCLDRNIYDVTCSGFHSCSFEPGDVCFLIHDTREDFGWKVSTSIPGDDSIQAYEGSYFVYIDGGYSTSGNRAVLFSNVEFQGYNWCLRFRYYITSERTKLDVVILNTVQNVTHTLMKSEEGWEYKEYAIMLEDFRIVFLAEEDYVWSTVALDDVTIVAGRCSETSTVLLYMKGGLKCGFEGRIDTCFDQGESDDFDWSITKGKTSTGYTGPGGSAEGNYYSYIEASDAYNGDTAVLVSKFQLTDTFVNFSMQYNMYGSETGSLKVFYQDISGKETKIFDVRGNQNRVWRRFTNVTKVTKQSKIYITASRGTGKKSDIAIDDIRIRIIEDDSTDGSSRSWMNASQKCIRNLGSYPIASREITNVACLSDGPERWTGIFRTRRTGSANEVSSRNPTAVRILRISRNISMNLWRPYDSNESRSFVCESERMDSRETCKVYGEESHVSEYVSEESNKTSLIAVTIVVVFALVLMVTIIVMIVRFRRKKGLECKQHDDISCTELSNVTYMNTDDKMATQQSVFTEKKSKHVSMSENAAKIEMSFPNTDDIYANQGMENMQSRARLAENDARMEQEDYDHLQREKGEMTSTIDDMYSHMTNNQNRVTLTADDMYSHLTNNENRMAATTDDVYSHMTNNENRMAATIDDVYSHMTNNENRMAATTDDVYSHVTNNEYGSQEMIFDSTYDRTEGVGGEYGGSQISKDLNETYDHAGFKASDEMYSFLDKENIH